MQKIEFERNIANFTAKANELGLWIYCGWSIPIARARAIEYVRTYNTNPDAGFLEHDEQITLTHNHGKISFTRQECVAFIQFIKFAYPEARLINKVEAPAAHCVA
jgi:hypothetical protein